jgi:hypothetical protein
MYLMLHLLIQGRFVVECRGVMDSLTILYSRDCVVLVDVIGLGTMKFRIVHDCLLFLHAFQFIIHNHAPHSMLRNIHS